MRYLVITLSLALTTSLRAAEPAVLDLWPGAPPAEKGGIGPETATPSKPPERPLIKVGNVTKPTLTVFRPAKELDTGAAVVIAPGGGYHILAWDLEGEEIARWLNAIGVTGIVLKYRVPRRPGESQDARPPAAAAADAQRAISLVRSKAKEWNLDPKKVGMLGFSAGGHLTAWACTNADKRVYEPVDAADKESSRPDFAVLVYPGYLVPKGRIELTPELRVTADTPPTFLAHAYDDTVTPESSVAYFLALKRAKVPAELHVVSTGGHGYGMRSDAGPAAQWPQRCEDWLRVAKVIPEKK